MQCLQYSSCVCLGVFILSTTGCSLKGNIHEENDSGISGPGSLSWASCFKQNNMSMGCYSYDLKTRLARVYVKVYACILIAVRGMM